MTDPNDDFDDPYADEDGHLGDLFVTEVGDDIAALLDDPATWSAPSDGLRDSILAEIRTETVSRRTVDTVPHDTVPHDGGSDDGGSELAPVVSISRWRSVRSGLIGAAAAIVLLAAGVVAFSAADDPPPQVAFEGELIPTGLVPDVSGEVAITAFQSGLQIELDAPSLPRRADGAFYEGWLRLDDDRLVPVGTFHEGGDVVLWAGIELDRIVLMTVTLEEAVAGASPDQASSGQVVLKVDIAVD